MTVDCVLVLGELEIPNHSRTMMNSLKKSQLGFFASVLILMNVTAFDSVGQALPVAPEPTKELPPGLIDAVIAIKTDQGSGTGFVAKYKDRFVIVTNQHVIDGVTNVELRTRSGQGLRPTSFVGAYDADLALLLLAEYNESSPYFEIASDINFFVKEGDAVVIPGNSLGDGVITVTPGKALNVGPQLLEVDNPVYPGNSGSPIFHMGSGKVIGVLTKAETRRKLTLDLVSKNSMKSKDSQVKSETRYFGHRIDSVVEWETFQWAEYQKLSNYLILSKNELDWIENFFVGDDSRFQDFKDLHDAVNEADQILMSDKFATAERTKALEKFVQRISSLTQRRLREYRSKPDLFIRPLYIQKQHLEEIESLTTAFNTEFSVIERNLEFWDKLIQRD